jgi:hypothetical protein
MYATTVVRIALHYVVVVLYYLLSILYIPTADVVTTSQVLILHLVIATTE